MKDNDIAYVDAARETMTLNAAMQPIHETPNHYDKTTRRGKFTIENDENDEIE